MSQNPLRNALRGYIPVWLAALVGALIVGGAVFWHQSGALSGGELAGYLVLPTLMGAGIAALLAKMQNGGAISRDTKQD